MDTKLKLIQEKLTEYNNLRDKELDTDSKRESKKLRSLMDNLEVEIHDLLVEYVDDKVPEEKLVTIKVEKQINYDLSGILDDLLYDIYDMNQEEIEDFDIDLYVEESIKASIDPEYYINDDDLEIIIND